MEQITNEMVSRAAAEVFRASTPLADALAAALSAAAAAEKAWLDCDCTDCTDSTGPRCELNDASIDADYAVDAARQALLDSDEPRPFLVRVDGAETTVTATSYDDAVEQGADWARDGNWDTSGGTVYVDYYVTDLAHERPKEQAHWHSGTVTIDQDEPECTHEDGHDWQSPHNIVGGIKENPGVWGHGGGVYIDECCMRCGCRRRTDTWAQRSDTGEQGLREVTYEAGFYADEIAALEEVA